MGIGSSQTQRNRGGQRAEGKEKENREGGIHKRAVARIFEPAKVELVRQFEIKSRGIPYRYLPYRGCEQTQKRRAIPRATKSRGRAASRNGEKSAVRMTADVIRRRRRAGKVGSAPPRYPAANRSREVPGSRTRAITSVAGYADVMRHRHRCRYHYHLHPLGKSERAVSRLPPVRPARRGKGPRASPRPSPGVVFIVGLVFNERGRAAD